MRSDYETVSWLSFEFKKLFLPFRRKPVVKKSLEVIYSFCFQQQIILLDTL